MNISPDVNNDESSCQKFREKLLLLLPHLYVKEYNLYSCKSFIEEKQHKILNCYTFDFWFYIQELRFLQLPKYLF